MKKNLFFFLGVAMIFFSFSSYPVSTSKQLEKQCVRIKCGKKAHYEVFTGVDEADIASQVKIKYNTCIWSKVPSKNCKTGKESKF
ncbi:MAG: hypothetical protein RL037_2170 [Bacteroidota bacterium]